MNKLKTLTIKEYELPITIQEEKEGGFTAVCMTWKNVYAQGATIEETINEISFVASSMIELFQEEEKLIPLKLKRSSEKQTKGFSLSIPVIVSR